MSSVSLCFTRILLRTLVLKHTCVSAPHPHPSLDFPLPKFQDGQVAHPSALPILLWEVAESAKRQGRSEQRLLTTQPRTRNGGQRGERGWAGQDKGFIVMTAWRLWMDKNSSPSQSVWHLPITGSLLQLEGDEVSTCYWKATWQHVRRASK